MKKKRVELILAILLLISLLCLSGKAAKTINSEKVTTEIILIDSGHGGEDPGVIGIDNLKEKDINLAIALKLKTNLEKEKYKVLMTREKDIGLYDPKTPNKKIQDLQRRCELIRQEIPALTISIHQNSYSDPSVKGPQVFYYTHSLEGEKLAKILQNQLNKSLKIDHPRIAKGNTSYYLLKKSQGILNIVECGFLTNPDEAELLATDTYQQKIADALTIGIQEYLETSTESPTASPAK